MCDFYTENASISETEFYKLRRFITTPWWMYFWFFEIVITKCVYRYRNLRIITSKQFTTWNLFQSLDVILKVIYKKVEHSILHQNQEFRFLNPGLSSALTLASKVGLEYCLLNRIGYVGFQRRWLSVWSLHNNTQVTRKDEINWHDLNVE